ncbi:MAG: biopolymer transport protein ExbD [Planctomycetota bacterium]|jgi:biopolymer transport protein ExbD
MRIRDDDLFEDAQLNLAPMIDVVFLLLIFFMVATTFAKEEEQLDVNLPASEAGEAVENPEEITIVLFEDGRMLLNGTEIEDLGLSAELRRLAQQDDSVPVTIRGDRDVVLQRVVAVMDACVMAGLSDVGMMTQDG